MLLSDKFEALASLPQHQKGHVKYLTYGTAGFRDNADLLPLDSVMFRVGCISGIRARCRGLACGVMITASHNEDTDNGAKIIDPEGSMLCESWEGFCEEVVNALSSEELATLLCDKLKSNKTTPALSGLVFVGCDTRKSSLRLLNCVLRGINAVNCVSENWGLLTTPALHHIVQQYS